jgi:RNA polymerase-binding transcription factor DksA
MEQVDNEVARRVEQTLDAVDRALERLRHGNYRTCRVCGSSIDDDVLASDPLRDSCDAHPELA